MGVLVEFGKLAKPATVLIKKISDATGVLYEPTRIRRKAKAEADASKTKALIDLEIEDIQNRALNRLVNEEIKKQENIENITEKAFSSLDENATPENIEDDWISNFFDKCKLISDDEMQTVWSEILAGEANNPGTFSKRTIAFMSTLDKSDAVLFSEFSKFCWFLGGYQPFIFDYQNKIIEKYNINFSTLQHLDELGLITFNTMSVFNLTSKVDNMNIGYYGRILKIDFKNSKTIETGLVCLTKIGADIIKVSQPKMNESKIINQNYIDDYYHNIIEELYKQNIIMSEPLSNKIYNKSLEVERGYHSDN